MGRPIRRCAQLALVGGMLGLQANHGSVAAASLDSQTVHGPISATDALRQNFHYVFDNHKGVRAKRRRRTPLGFTYMDPTVEERRSSAPSLSWEEPQSLIGRRRAEDNYYNGDDANNGDDNVNNGDDDAVANADDDAAAAANDDDYNNYDDDSVNEACSQYLVSFLEGSTDARDTCEGIMNAYTAAGTFVSHYKRVEVEITLDMDLPRS